MPLFLLKGRHLPYTRISRQTNGHTGMLSAALIQLTLHTHADLTDRQTNSARLTQITARADRQADRQTDKPADRPTDRQTAPGSHISLHEQTDRQTGRQTGRQAGRQTDKHGQIHLRQVGEMKYDRSTVR